MKIEPLFEFKLPCWFPFTGHEWPNWEFTPCKRYRYCTKCNLLEQEQGWHKFGKWSDPYSVNVYDSSSRKVSQERQKRICTDCNEMDERTIGY